MMTDPVRQGADSEIVKFAHEVRNGSHGLKPFDLVLSQRKLPGLEIRQAKGGDADLSELATYDVVIVFRNKTRVAMNKGIRRELGVNHPFPRGEPGEKVLCIENNYAYGVMRGEPIRVEQGRAKELNKTAFYGRLLDGVTGKLIHEEAEFTLSFLDVEKFDHSGLVSTMIVEWGYAVTAHAAQGSEWERVVVLANDYTAKDGFNRWLYTAVTRARREALILV